MICNQQQILESRLTQDLYMSSSSSENDLEEEPAPQLENISDSIKQKLDIKNLPDFFSSDSKYTQRNDLPISKSLDLTRNRFKQNLAASLEKLNLDRPASDDQGEFIENNLCDVSSDELESNSVSLCKKKRKNRTKTKSQKDNHFWQKMIIKEPKIYSPYGLSNHELYKMTYTELKQIADNFGLILPGHQKKIKSGQSKAFYIKLIMAGNDLSYIESLSKKEKLKEFLHSNNVIKRLIGAGVPDLERFLNNNIKYGMNFSTNPEALRQCELLSQYLNPCLLQAIQHRRFEISGPESLKTVIFSDYCKICERRDLRQPRCKDLLKQPDLDEKYRYDRKNEENECYDEDDQLNRMRLVMNSDLNTFKLLAEIIKKSKIHMTKVLYIRRPMF